MDMFRFMKQIVVKHSKHLTSEIKSDSFKLITILIKNPSSNCLYNTDPTYIGNTIRASKK